jgi:LCP family protein required for cell wall assembly
MRRHKALVALLGLTGVLLVAVAGMAVYVTGRIDGLTRIDLNQPTALGPGLVEADRPPRPTGEAAGSVNILLAGLDAGEDAPPVAQLASGEWVPGSHRSDTIMILHLDADRRHAYVISIPRDTWVVIDGHGPAKINAALSYGGAPLYVRTIEQFTGLRMDHLVLVDWRGFMDLTDAMGGVQLAAPAGSSSGAATVELTGEEALDYVRERKSLPRGDLDRTQRQQNVLRALLDQTLSAGTLANPFKLQDVLTAVTDNVAVDSSLTTRRILDLSLSLRNLRGGDAVSYLNVPVRAFDMIEGQSVVLVDRPAARALFSATRADELDEYVATHEVDSLPAPAYVP